MRLNHFAPILVSNLEDSSDQLNWTITSLFSSTDSSVDYAWKHHHQQRVYPTINFSHSQLNYLCMFFSQIDSVNLFFDSGLPSIFSCKWIFTCPWIGKSTMHRSWDELVWFIWFHKIQNQIGTTGLIQVKSGEKFLVYLHMTVYWPFTELKARKHAHFVF